MVSGVDFASAAAFDASAGSLLHRFSHRSKVPLARGVDVSPM
jgi:hypothetical protein